MLIKIKRQDCLDKFPKFPQREYNSIKDEEEFFYPKVIESYILTLDTKSLKGHTKLLVTELSRLTKDFGFDSVSSGGVPNKCGGDNCRRKPIANDTGLL